MRARGDVANEILSNGEFMVQQCVVEGWKNKPDSEAKLVVFDVGANVGNWSELLLAHIDSLHNNNIIPCDLHLFEPISETFTTLKKRFQDSGHSTSLYFHQLALSSSKGNDQMYLLGASGINSIHSDKTNGNAASVTITKDTAANICVSHAISKIHLLKSDTEGHDMEVILGALPLLRENRISVLQFEYNHRWVYSRHFLKDVFDSIYQLPYRIGKIQSDHIELYTDWHPEMERFFEANYILIHEDSLSWFSTRETTFDKHNTAASSFL